VTKPYGEVEMKLLPGWKTRLIIWKTAYFSLGLSVVGTGITQFINARAIEKS
jgi:hypothetical protein